eukprot:4027823-Amphidinium_carterae.1
MQTGARHTLVEDIRMASRSTCRSKTFVWTRIKSCVKRLFCMPKRGVHSYKPGGVAKPRADPPGRPHELERQRRAKAKTARTTKARARSNRKPT